MASLVFEQSYGQVDGDPCQAWPDGPGGAARGPGSGRGPVLACCQDVTVSLVGRTVGNIRLDVLLGVGGMGEVYRGFDEKLQRVVAVKTIRSEHRLAGDSKARFLREARILSRLAHPSICQVYDLVQTEAADYLVFEFVEGVTLDDLARTRPLDEREVLELGARICEALAVAHRERIIHRDLKPANIMVGGNGAIKVLDFGIARSAAEAEAAAQSPILSAPGDLPTGGAEGRDPDGTIAFRGADNPTSGEISAALTQHGVIVGTVRYMSPEQAGGEELTEASDMFSFGIVLQELLMGRPAYAEAPVAELLRDVAQHRSLPVNGVDSDLSRLVEDLKHPIPERRPSADETLQRLRFILARPQRARRRRILLGSAAAAFVLLTVVLAVVSVLAVRAQRARTRAEGLAGRLEKEAERANREATTANRVAGFLVDLFEEADPESAQGREVTVREVVAKGSARIESQLSDEPLIQARLETTLGGISWRLGDAKEAAKLLERALATSERERASDGIAVAEVLSQLGAVYADQQRFDDAQRTLVRALHLLESLPSRPAADLARTLNSMGTVALHRGQAKEAESLFLRALEAWGGLARPDQREVAGTLNNLAILAWQRADYPAAEGFYRRALEIDEKRLGPDDPRLVAPLNNMGILLRDQGRLEEAEHLQIRALAIAEKALGPEHPDVASVLSSLARLYGKQGRVSEGKELLERALGIVRSTYGPAHPETGTTMVRLGDFERRSGHLDRAEKLISGGRKVLQSALGEDHPRLVEALTALGRLRRDQHRYRQAESTLLEAERIATVVFGSGHPEVAAIRADLAALPHADGHTL